MQKENKSNKAPLTYDAVGTQKWPAWPITAKSFQLDLIQSCKLSLKLINILHPQVIISSLHCILLKLKCICWVLFAAAGKCSDADVCRNSRLILLAYS